MKAVEAILIGAGKRGYNVYGDYAQRFPHKLRYVAVAEPDEKRRNAFAEKFQIPQNRRFASWEELIDKQKMADAAFIVTMDKMHFQPTIEMLRQGYHVIVEKPMAVNPVECVAMVEASKTFGRLLSIGHVLRFIPFYQEVHKILRSGQLGEIVSINQNECVGFWHFAHSFVRSNWARTCESAPSILSKCCHDLDILCWLVGSPVRYVASMGNLFEFLAEKAPGEVPERCTECCRYERTCPYSAYKLYLEPGRGWMKSFFQKNFGEGEDLLEQLKTTCYSQCVYLGKNDVCDQQVVTMEFENNAIATLTMQAHTRDDTRKLRICGTRGELHGHLEKNEILVRDFATDKLTCLTPEVIESSHMGGDIVLIDDFIHAIREGSNGHLSSVSESLESHLLAFAAERSRIERKFINMAEYTLEVEHQAKSLRLS